MNERIQEKLPNPFKALGQQISYSGFDTAFCDLYNKEQMIKFAELIINQCADIAQQHNKSPVAAPLAIGYVIREHFGVEE